MRLLILLLALSLNANAWGPTGHRTIGKYSEQFLSRKAKKNIAKILNGQSLELISTYADEIKSDKNFKKYSPWHYVNFHEDYKTEAHSKKGDLIFAIDKCITILKNKKEDKAKRAFYLKMLVHLIGDLHQPLHVGNAEDWGGNKIQVRWFDKGSNLHRVWDENMIKTYAMSYSELVENFPKLTKKQVKSIQNGSVLKWVYESKKLSKKVYASAKSGEKLSYEYSYNHLPIAKSQMQKAGIRLAKVLNDIFR